MKSITKPLTIALCLAAGSLFLCRTASAQQPVSPTYFSLENFNSRFCLSLPGPANELYPGDGLQLTQEPCDGRQGEIWYQGDHIWDSTNGDGDFVSTLASDYYCCSLMVAGVQADVMQNGTSVITWSEDPINYGSFWSNNQGWSFQNYTVLFNSPQAPTCYYIVNTGAVPFQNYTPGYFVMGVLGASWEPGAPIVIWSTFQQPDFTYHPNPDQIWCAISPGPPSPYL